jgi:hypothetical protein
MWLHWLCCISCHVYRYGNISGSSLLSVKDKYVDIACGEVKTRIGGEAYSKELLIMEAKANMFKNRPLKKGEYYSNFILNKVKWIW